MCRCSGAGEVAPSRGVWGLVAHHVPTCWSGPLPPTRQALYRRYIPLGWGKTQVNLILYWRDMQPGAALQQVPWGCWCRSAECQAFRGCIAGLLGVRCVLVTPQSTLQRAVRAALLTLGPGP